MVLSLALWGNATEAKFNEEIPQDNVEENISRVYQAQSVITYYVVSKGDNLKKIAQKNEVSAEEIRIWNNLESDNIPVGSKLKIQTIEYVLVEEPQLREPELLAIHFDENAASGIMADYVGKQVENTVICDRGSDIEDISQQVALYAESNMKDYREVITAKKNGFWNKLSDVTNTAFSSVKNFSGTLVNKLKPGKPSEVLLAENNAVKTEESSVKEIIEDIAEIQEDIQLDSADAESSYLADGLKKVYHKVKIGETITQIATRYNVSKEDIITWNNLSSGMAKVRQRLLIYIPKDYTYVSNHNRVGYY